MHTQCRAKLDYYTANYMDTIPATFASPRLPADHHQPSVSPARSPPPPLRNDNDADGRRDDIVKYVDDGRRSIGIGESTDPIHVQVARIEDDLR